jgi:flagellar biosynthetic protein FlhB
MESEEQDKSEQASTFKLQQARRKGTVARGSDLGFLIGIVVMLYYARFAGVQLAAIIAGGARDTLVTGSQTGEGAAVLGLVPVLFEPVMASLTLMLAVLFATVLLFEIVQTGVVFSAEPLKLTFSRLNPAQGLKRLFAFRMLIETGKNVLKFLFYVTVAVLVVRGALNSDLGLVTDANGLLRFMTGIAGRLVVGFVLVAILFAVLDQLIVRREFRKKMRMSRRELKREVRDREGDARLKQRRKQIHAEFVKLSESVRNLRGADVVITNPEHIALALRYDGATMAAPKIVSIGTNRVALRLKNLALVYGVPVIENRPLARALYAAGALNREVPEACFAPVADIYNGLRRNGQRLSGQSS